MGGPYTALTKQDLGDGRMKITDTINGDEEIWDKADWDAGAYNAGKTPLKGGDADRDRDKTKKGRR